MSAVQEEAIHLNAIAIDRIISMAPLCVDGENVEQVYNASKAALRQFVLTPEEYESAIRRLAEALKI